MPPRTGLPHLFLHCRRRPEFGGQIRQIAAVHPVAGDMGHEIAHGHLGEFANHPRMSGAGDAAHHAAFQRGAAENARLDVGHIRQVEARFGERLALRAGGQHYMGQPVGGGYIDGQVDAGAPGGGGVGLHHAGAAQNGDAAQHAQAGVGGFQRNLFAAGHGYLDDDVAARRQSGGGGPGQGRLGNHPAGDAGNGRFAHRNAGAGPGHRANPRPPGDAYLRRNAIRRRPGGIRGCRNAAICVGRRPAGCARFRGCRNAAICRNQRYGGADFGAVGGVGVVAAVFQHRADYPPAVQMLAAMHRKLHLPAHRQMDADPFHRLPGEEGGDGGFGGGGGAGAGGIAGTQSLAPHRLAAVVAFRQTAAGGRGAIVAVVIHSGYRAARNSGFGLAGMLLAAGFQACGAGVWDCQTWRMRLAVTATTRSSTPSGGVMDSGMDGYCRRICSSPPSTLRRRISPGKNR